jgi:hypothetical protein
VARPAAAPAVTPRKAPVAAAAPSGTSSRPAARPRTTEGNSAPAKRTGARQKVLADPDSTLPLTFD